MSTKQELRACNKRIGEIETVVEALTDGAEKFRAKGDDDMANKVELKIEDYKDELDIKTRESDELLEKLEAEAALREQTDLFVLEESSAMYVHLCQTAESWMRNHYFSDEDRSLWDKFLQDHPEMA